MRWLAELKQIDPAAIAAAPLRATYAIVRRRIESDVAKRVCRDELWPVSQMTGWQVNDGYLVTIQPVGTDEPAGRARALGPLPKYIDTEIANLREGIKPGYTAPKLNVRIVIDQVSTLASTPLKDSPFDSPAMRDKTPEFQKQFNALVARADRCRRRSATPISSRRSTCRRRARRSPSTANPNGAACYDASVLYHSSSPKTAQRGPRARRARRTSASTLR